MKHVRRKKKQGKKDGTEGKKEKTRGIINAASNSIANDDECRKIVSSGELASRPRQAIFYVWRKCNKTARRQHKTTAQEHKTKGTEKQLNRFLLQIFGSLGLEVLPEVTESEWVNMEIADSFLCALVYSGTSSLSSSLCLSPS